MAMPNRTVVAWTLLGGLASVVALILWLQEPEVPEEATKPMRDHAGSSIPLREMGKWIEHLQQEGEIRLVRSEAPSLGDGAKKVAGLGMLTEAEMAFAASSVERVIEKQRTALQRHYAGSRFSSKSPEAWALEEARLVLDLTKYEAFGDALRRSSYVLAKGYNDKPPTPEGVLALNLGVVHGGSDVLLVIYLDKREAALEGVEEHYEQCRRRWAAAVAYAFNSRPQSQREHMIERWSRNDSKDRRWREENFPDPIMVDVDRALVFVEER